MTEKQAQLVEFSDTAKEKLAEFLKEQGAESAYLRINVSPRPEGGAFYEFGVEDQAGDSDSILNDTVRTLAYTESAELLRGASIDYVETMQRSGFVISNPNFAGCACGGGGCGCGG